MSKELRENMEITFHQIKNNNKVTDIIKGKKNTRNVGAEKCNN